MNFPQPEIDKSGEPSENLFRTSLSQTLIRGRTTAKDGFSANKLNKASQLTGFSDPVYAEAYAHVKHDTVPDALLTNQANDIPQHCTLELATLALGDSKLAKKRQPVPEPKDNCNIKANLKNNMDQIFVLPDEVLRQQICSECYLYLSVIPVRVNGKGEKICGRCFLKVLPRNNHVNFYLRGTGRGKNTRQRHTRILQDKNLSTSSPFNFVSQYVLYKCVNHFDGCKALLRTCETLIHERRCVSKTRNCFFCSFRGNVCQIVNHCAKTHTDNLTWDGILEFDLNSSNFFTQAIFVRNNSIFLIIIKTSLEDLNIIISSEVLQMSIIKQYAIRFWLSKDPDISAVEFIDYGLFNMENETCFKKSLKELRYHFGNTEGNIKCQILLNQMEVTDKEIEVDKRYRNLRIREQNLILQEKELKDELVHLNNEKTNLESKFNDIRINLEAEKRSLDSLKNLLKVLSYDFFSCMNCQQITTESVYFCVRQHCYCKKCLTNNCIKCNTISEFTELTNFDKIMVKCEWPLCSTDVRFKDYITHKKTCQMRPYECPLRNCKETLYTSVTLTAHWHSIIPAIITRNEIACSKHDRYEYYWLWKHDLYHVLIQFSEKGAEIIIEEVNVLPNNNTFSFEGHCSGYNIWNDPDKFSNFCGKLKFYREKSNRGYAYDRFRIVVA